MADKSETLNERWILIQIFLRRDDYASAANALEKMIFVYTRRYGWSHEWARKLQNTLAECYLELDREHEALQILQSVLDHARHDILRYFAGGSTSKEVVGPSSPPSWSALGALAGTEPNGLVYASDCTGLKVVGQDSEHCTYSRILARHRSGEGFLIKCFSKLRLQSR